MREILALILVVSVLCYIDRAYSNNKWNIRDAACFYAQKEKIKPGSGFNLTTIYKDRLWRKSDDAVIQSCNRMGYDIKTIRRPPRSSSKAKQGIEANFEAFKYANYRDGIPIDYQIFRDDEVEIYPEKLTTTESPFDLKELVKSSGNSVIEVSRLNDAHVLGPPEVITPIVT